MKKNIACPSCKGKGFNVIITGDRNDYCGIGSEMCSVCGGTGVQEVGMTNADRIRAMSDEELGNFLINVAYAGNDPWCIPFTRKFCDNCPTYEGTIVETGQTMDFHECDFADGKCPHGSDVVWWLKQAAEVEL